MILKIQNHLKVQYTMQQHQRKRSRNDENLISSIYTHICH